MALSRAILLFLAGFGFLAASPLAQQPAAPARPALGNDLSHAVTVNPAQRATNSAPKYNYPPPPAYLAAPPQFFRPLTPTNSPIARASNNLVARPLQKEVAKRASNTNIVFDANIKEAIELYLETLPAEERDLLLSREILTTAVEVNA